MINHRRSAIVGFVMLLVLSLVGPSAVLGDPTDPTQVPTTTTLTIDPTTSLAGQEVRVVAQVTPVPDSGWIHFVLWTAESGGTSVPYVEERVDANGRVVLPDATATPGVHWMQAYFMGSSYFGPSASARVMETVQARPTTPTLTLQSTELAQGQDLAFSFSLAPPEVAYGYVELLVDGDVYWSQRTSPSSQRSYQVPGTFDRGVHEVKLRLRTNAWNYADGESAAQMLRVGDVSTPTDGVRINHGAVFSRARQVGLSVGWPAATHVRVSNDATLAEGLLANGTTFVRTDAQMPWVLAGGTDGARTVWVQYEDSGGSWSSPVSDGIYLDTTAPTGSFVINDDDVRVGDMWSGTMYEQRLHWLAADASGGGPGGSITHVAISNDGQKWWVQPFVGNAADSTTPWQIISDWGATNDANEANPACGPDDFTRPVYMKWRDAAGNWSPVATDTIEVYWDTTPVRVLIDGHYGYRCGFEYISSSTVTLTFPIRDMPAEGLDRIRIRGAYGATWKTLDWHPGLTIEWSLTSSTYGYTSGDGLKNIFAEAITTSGGKRTFGDLIILDRADPTSASPVPAFALNSVVEPVGVAASGLGTNASTTAVAAEIKWSGKDGGEVASYRLQRSVNAATWTSVALADPSVPNARQVVQQGKSFRYRARSIDGAGNIGAWKAGPTFGVAVRQETSSSIIYKGQWQPQARSDALGGSLRVTNTLGASAKLTFTGRGVAWVAPRSVNGDSVDVYVDGVRIKTVHLSLSAGYHPRRVVFSTAWKAAGTHTIRIVKKYNNGYALPIDAFVILK